MTEPFDVSIKSLGSPRIDSPLAASDVAHRPYLVGDDQKILVDDRILSSLAASTATGTAAFELAGPRSKIYFDPSSTTIGIVTCGGLCPGMNDVIRGLVMESYYRYGVRKILGFRNGYRGCVGRHERDILPLDPDSVSDIHEHGGSLLGTSRGPEEPAAIVDNLVRLKVDILYVVGGDGTMRGGLAIAHEIDRRSLKIGIVGLPKTIDNDIQFVDKSFGFETAFSKAVEAIYAAHTEARSTPNGVGIVKLMGRHCGFIACYASLATSHVNFTLIPEVPFQLSGDRGFLHALQQRLEHRAHAVVVVAEGAGQDLMTQTTEQKDASGNIKLKDIGTFLSQQIKTHFDGAGEEVTLKYIDPSYIIRSVPATPVDSVFCWRLAQSAVHGAMCGKTEMVVGQWHGRLVHIPMLLTTSGRKQVDPQGELWASVLESTGQPTNLY
jgi:6-phosphofructokinase 1